MLRDIRGSQASWAQVSSALTTSAPGLSFLMCKRDIPATASGGHCENWVNTQIVST